MTLRSLIQKRHSKKDATATPATFATQHGANAGTVARIATVAVANPSGSQTVPLTAAEETAVRTWLDDIDETDPTIITELLNKCNTDEKAKAYFLRRTEEVPKPLPFNDDRRYCTECANLTANGLCVAARRGEVMASRTYHPVDHIPRRCEGYAPGPNDTDRRPGRERWPDLLQERGNHADD